jgi:hypothetical protein
MEDQIGIFVSRDGLSLEVRISKETVWLSQEQLASLFERDISVISRHLGNVFKEGELEKEGNLQKMQTGRYGQQAGTRGGRLNHDVRLPYISWKSESRRLR